MNEDFSKGKRGPVIQSDPNKVRITIRLDGDIIEHFKSQVHSASNYLRVIFQVNFNAEFFKNAYFSYFRISGSRKIKKIARKRLKYEQF